MAHALDTRDTGTAAFVALRRSAWHQLGTIMQDEMSFDEAMTLGGLDYPLALRPVRTTVPIFTADGEEHDAIEIAAPAQAIVRLDRREALGVVGLQYELVSNREAMGLIESMVDQGLAVIETAGVLRGGRDAWMAVRFTGEAFDAAADNGGDPVRFYGVVRTNHDGRASVQMATTPIRIVCANTLAMALRDNRTTIHAVRHTRSAGTRIAEAARRAWGGALKDAAAQAEAFRALREIELTPAQFQSLVLDAVAPLPAPPMPGASERSRALHASAVSRAESDRATVRRLLMDGRGNDGSLSAWNAFNALTEAVDHWNVGSARRGAAKSETLVAQLPGGAIQQLKVGVWNNLLALAA